MKKYYDLEVFYYIDLRQVFFMQQYLICFVNYCVKLDVADLKEVYRKQLEEGPDDQQQQRLVQQYQRAVARQSAATAIKNTYILILNILKKVCDYFENCCILRQQGISQNHFYYTT